MLTPARLPVGLDHRRQDGELFLESVGRWADAVGEAGARPVVANHGGESPSRSTNRRKRGSCQSSWRWLDHQPPMTSTGPEPTEDQATERPSRAAWRTTWSMGGHG